MSKDRFTDGKNEYKYFIQTYLLPIIGVSYNNNLRDIKKNASVSAKSVIRQESTRIIFSAYNLDLFFIEHRTHIAEDALKLAKNIIPAFFAVSKYKMNGSFKSINIDYATDEIHEENFRLAVQKGICDWCMGSHSDAFYELFQIMEQWSVRTYEGKKVTFGFVIDPSAKSSFVNDNYGTWFDFLKDDYAATLTDCIHSVIKLDANCDFSSYLSITEGDTVEAFNLSSRLPYRFARAIENHVKGSCVGVFLLNNGDIILSKNQSIRLVKRNLKWLNLSFETFRNAIIDRLPAEIELDDILLEHIYASTLDVSFAHTGGIIALVNDASRLWKYKNGSAMKNPILNPCDYLQSHSSFEEIEEKLRNAREKKKLKPHEINKRLLKRKAIICLVGGKDFTQIDRKLRTELISMDGACIIDAEGNVCAFGAIIQNESGSAGGGRSAAARELSRYGLAVKISTDGYIELFISGEPVYAIK